MHSTVVSASPNALGRTHFRKMILFQRRQANILPIVTGLISGTCPHTLAGDGMILIRGKWPFYCQVNVSKNQKIGNSEMSTLEGGVLFFPSPTHFLLEMLWQKTPPGKSHCVLSISHGFLLWQCPHNTIVCFSIIKLLVCISQVRLGLVMVTSKPNPSGLKE